ncbi:MAG: hypothetical protein AB7O43_18380 [Hyphomicrobiaceae bacterium]
MSQRESGYERKERDLYETPEWVTEALVPHLPDYIDLIWEPACGNGKMVRAIESACPGVTVWASDIEPADKLHMLEIDFLSSAISIGHEYGAIVTNPPYDQAAVFCEEALRKTEPTQGVVAMLLRTDFDHAKSRFHLFRDCPAFSKKLVLTRRIVWFAEPNGKPKAQPSFNHAWFVWDWRHDGPPTIAYA